jgi:hypothetical protein
MKTQTLDNTREVILFRFYNEFIIPLFLKNGYTLPVNVKISIGKQEHKNAIGSTYHPIIGGGYYHIFIAPKIAKNVYQVFDTLIHEAIHTLFFDHRGGFSTCAKAVGLVKPWTATTGSDKLEEDITQWLTDNDLYWYEPELKDIDFKPQDPKSGGGGFPSGGAIGSPKKQPSRMIKITCPICGYIVRTANKNIEVKGFPICPVDNVPFAL